RKASASRPSFTTPSTRSAMASPRHDMRSGSALRWSIENEGVPQTLLLACRAGAAVQSRAEEGRVMIRMPVAVAAAALASLLAFSPRARGETSIAAIVDHPDEYANTQVTVVGTIAAPNLGYLGES